VNDAELLAFHARLVAAKSVSKDEGPAADAAEDLLRARGVAPIRLDRNVAAVHGPEGAPTLHLCSHLDTVPPSPAWTRDPWTPAVVDGRVYGLGSNDAKASVAAMTAAFLRLRGSGLPLRLVLVLTAEEETGGKGAEALLPELARRGLAPDAALIGEPTSLDLAVAQKGLMVCELRATGRAVHAAHARALGAPNAIRLLARDLVALEDVDLGPDDADLGPTTMEPTVLTGGSARNLNPAEATCILDVRVNPAPGPEEIAARLRARVRHGELKVLSQRLRPQATPVDAAIVDACRTARPAARAFGSRGVSDWCFYGGVPAVKVGPGATERSHTPDEWVGVDEILAGAAFYEAAARAFAAKAAAPRGAAAGEGR
jgi:acetylornithine deacetylase